MQFVKFGEFMVKLLQQDSHVFLLAGEEHYYIDKALAKIMAGLFSDSQEAADSVQKLNGEVDADDLVSMINTAPFFTETIKRFVYGTAPSGGEELLRIRLHEPINCNL